MLFGVVLVATTNELARKYLLVEVHGIQEQKSKVSEIIIETTSALIFRFS